MTEKIPLVLKPTYNPQCSDFDEYLSNCKISQLICREEICHKKLISEIQNLQFKIIKARSKRKELRDKKHELFIAYSWLELQEKTEDTKRLLDKIGIESKTTAEEYCQTKNNVNDLEQELYSLIDNARSKGIQLEPVLDPGWVYVFTEEK